MHMTTQTIAAEARAALARERTKQADVAKALGLSQSQLSRRLSGKISFTAEEFYAMSRFLNVPISALYGEASPRSAPASSTSPHVELAGVSLSPPALAA